MIAWDTETCLIEQALLAPPLVCVSWATPDGNAGVVHWQESYELCETILSTSSIGANAPYDLAVIGNQFPDLMPQIFEALAEDRIHDVLLRQKLLDIAEGCYRGYRHIGGKVGQLKYGLADLSKRFEVADLDKDTWRLRYAELRPFPVQQWPEAAVEYSEMDARATLGVFLAQEEEAARILEEFYPDSTKPILENEAAQVRAHWALHLATCWGIKTDQKALLALEARLDEEWERLRGELRKDGLIRPTGARNMKAAKERMVNALGDNCFLTDTGVKKARAEIVEQFGSVPFDIDPDILLKTKRKMIDAGYVSLDEESCLESKDPVLAKFARFAHLIKLKSTYVEAMKGGWDKPLQPRYEPLLETGRVSCSSPNIQQMPRDEGIRECFVPRPGKVFVSADFDKAELVSLAQCCVEVCGWSKLAERLNKGFDPHLDMGAQLLHIDYEEALRRYKLDDKVVADMRQMSKAANFGLPGGLGADTFIQFAKGYGVILTREEAVALKAQWHETWPEMQQYFDWVNELMNNGRAYIKHFMSNRCRGDVSYTATCNTFFQGRTADGAKDAAWEITRRQFLPEMESPLYGSRIVAFIHDEFILEADEHIAHDVAMVLKDVMVNSFRKFHPDLHDAVNATPVVMRRWSKKAKPIKDANGKLIPWDWKQAA